MEEKVDKVWPGETVPNLIVPRGMRRIYKVLKDPKEQDVTWAWLGRYLCTGEDRAGYRIPEERKINLIDEVSRMFGRQDAQARNGARGGRPPKANQKPNESEGQPGVKSQAKANEKPSESKRKREKEEEKEESTHFVCAKEEPHTQKSQETTNQRTDEPTKGVDGTATAEEEARRLGYGQYAGVAEELRGLIPAGVPMAAVFIAAEAKAFTGEELVQFANHYAANGWRTSQGRGMPIRANNIGNVLAVWAGNRASLARNGGRTNGSGETGKRDRVFDSSRPIQVQRGNLDTSDLPF